MKHNWEISSDLSSIEFSLKYYEIGRIKGCFRKFDGEIVAGKDMSNPEIELKILAKSISTLDTEWDNKLISAGFLSAEQFPQIVFLSGQGCRLSEGGIQELTGNLTIKEHGSMVTLLVTSGAMENTRKQLRARFILTAVLLLSEYGFEYGNPVFGNEVNLSVKLILTSPHKRC
jgi:polyisoprenoid-binding protein YceI